jgi:putative glutamine amidotransferase
VPDTAAAGLVRVALPRWRAANIQAYRDRLSETGLEPIDLWPGELEGFASCNGLLLPGGVDIDPTRYGAVSGPHTQVPDPERDEFELALLAAALARDLPVLAICRGHQLLNVAFGGSLLQHIENGGHEARELADKSVSRRHAVALAPDSQLGEVFAKAALAVNSRHHQSVTPATIAPGLRATAWSDDGMVEGLQSDGHRWVVSVQWHPERPEPELPGFAESSRRLFAAFATQVSSGRRPE